MKYNSNFNVLSSPTIWLASRSPRRAQLLGSLGFAHRIEFPSTANEILIENDPQGTAKHNALFKARSIYQKICNPEDIILSADTLVTISNEILGKPKSKEEAIRSLFKLSGKRHVVVTGMCVLSKKCGTRISVEETEVQFRNLSEDEIARYCELEEPFDKAGAYAAQGVGALFIGEIKGSYTNVLGLPIERLLLELSELTGTSPFDWFPKRSI